MTRRSYLRVLKPRNRRSHRSHLEPLVRGRSVGALWAAIQKAVDVKRNEETIEKRYRHERRPSPARRAHMRRQ